MMNRIRQWLISASDKDASLLVAPKAEAWLQDETLNAALAEIRQNTLDAWYASKDPEARERAWITMHLTDQFVAALNSLVVRAQAHTRAEELYTIRRNR